MIGKDGVALRDERGKVCWQPLIEFSAASVAKPGAAK
jgi:hypothetical protein